MISKTGSYAYRLIFQQKLDKSYEWHTPVEKERKPATWDESRRANCWRDQRVVLILSKSFSPSRCIQLNGTFRPYLGHSCSRDNLPTRVSRMAVQIPLRNFVNIAKTQWAQSLEVSGWKLAGPFSLTYLGIFNSLKTTSSNSQLTMEPVINEVNSLFRRS